MHWHLLRLNPQNQAQFVDYIAEKAPDQILYYPKYYRMTRPAHKRTPIRIECPVYPGYVFSLTCDRLLCITPIRAYFVRLKNLGPDSVPQISTIPDRVIQELKRLEGLNQLIHEVKIENPFKPGRHVIIHTPVSDIHGIIIRLLGQTRAVVQTPLGRAVQPLATLAIPTPRE